MSDKLAYNVSEAHTLLGVGRSQFFDLIRRGEVPSIKVGRRRLIPADALRAYIDRLVTEQQKEHGGAA